MNTRKNFIVAIILALVTFSVTSAGEPTIRITKKGIEYIADERGDRVPDFSAAGYAGGGVAIPSPKETIVLEALETGADETDRIQDALNELGNRPLDENGFRGVLLLKRGVYPVSKQLVINHAGVVLRGEGSGKDGTVLFATSRNKDSLFMIGGVTRYRTIGKGISVADDYVPVGAKTLTLESTDGLKVGSGILLTRKGNAEWIHEIGMDAIPQRKDGGKIVQWKPFDVETQYTIVAIDGNRITLDSSVFCSIDRRWGGGSVVPIRDDRIMRCGIENIRCVTAFDVSVVDKNHYADVEKAIGVVEVKLARDVWLRNIHGVHFDRVLVFERFAFQCTGEDCVALKPVSPVKGGCRYPFLFNGSTRILVQRCFAESCRHPFALGSRGRGPNVFLDCLSIDDHGSSEPHMRWSYGGLYDNISGNLSIMNRGAGGSGHGWAGANFVAWNTEGGTITIHSPPTAHNWSFGSLGKRRNRDQPPGVWVSEGRKMPIRSLYLAQLENAKGKEAILAVTNENQRKGSTNRLLRETYAPKDNNYWKAGHAPDWTKGYTPKQMEMMKKIVSAR